MEQIKKNLARNLTLLRKEKNITQSQLAAKLNYSDKSISKWENGDTVPDIHVLSLLAEYYGVTVDFLISEKKEKPPAPVFDKYQVRNTVLVMALFISIIWICATIIYSQLRIWLNRDLWTIFIWAVPASCLLLLVLNRVWLKHSFAFVLSSIFIWTLLASFHIQFLSYNLNLWVVYFIGAPCQIALIILKNLERYTRKAAAAAAESEASAEEVPESAERVDAAV